MPQICYVPKRFRAEALKIIEAANSILSTYAAQGFDVTLRQLYYQFVQRGTIPNTERDYKRLGEIINDARLAGLLDWTAIVDRTRFVRKNPHWNAPSEIVSSCAEQFQVDKWTGQEYYVEVWIEKDALIGVIGGVCRSLDAPHFSCRGYVSQTAVWGAAQRIKGRVQAGQRAVVIHLGDHDPSGLDMTRDIQERLNLFAEHYGSSIKVERIALTMEQIEEHNPPPNPAKESDSRAHDYIIKYGASSWELDSLDPATLANLVRSAIRRYLDAAAFNKRAKVEKAYRELLKMVSESLAKSEAEARSKGGSKPPRKKR